MLNKITSENGTVYFESPALKTLGVPHGFSTRLGKDGDSQFSLASSHPQNNISFAKTLGCKKRQITTVHQVHGTFVKEGCPPQILPTCEADAIVSSDPSQLLLIRTADCVPVLLATADGTRVAAVHAGWKGLVAGVLLNAVKALLERTPTVREGTSAGLNNAQTSPPLRSGFFCAIGPCMGVEKFEVDEDVARVFDAANLGEAVDRTTWPKPHVNLRLAAEIQLQRAGALQIDSDDLCTYRDEALFFSHRRDRTHRGLPKTGHMGACIGVKSFAMFFYCAVLVSCTSVFINFT